MKNISLALFALLTLKAGASFKHDPLMATSSSKPSSSSSSIYIPPPPPPDLAKLTTRVYFKPKFVQTMYFDQPMGSLYVGGQELYMCIDPHSSESVLKIDQTNQMFQLDNIMVPEMLNQSLPIIFPPVNDHQGYNYFISNTLQIDDPLRYYGGSQGSIGYWGNDLFTFSMTDFNLSKAFNMTQDAVGASIGPIQSSDCEGTLGLGLGQPRYGKSFIQNIKSQFGDRFVEKWSYVQGPFKENQTSILIGGSQKGFNSTIFTYYNVTKPNTWTINASNIAVQKIGSADHPNQPIVKYNATDLWSVFNATQQGYTFVDIFSKVILLPNATFQNISAVWKTQSPGLKCNNTGCYSNQVCSALNAISNIVFMFGNQTYTLSATDVLIDLDPMGCYIPVGVNTASASTVLGQPFFNGFTVQFDTKLADIGFAQVINSYSTVY